MARYTHVLARAGVAALLLTGCSQPGAPMSPSAAAPGLGAAADGSTVKASAPGIVSPQGGVQLDTLMPELVVDNASALYTDTPTFEYRFEIQTPGGQPVMNSPKVGVGNGRTRWTTPVDLELDMLYRWRARVEIGSNYGPWSSWAEFRSLDYRGLNPRPADGVWPSDGPSVLDYIAAAFPDYLLPTGDLNHRIENTEFLRDRIIEAGICGGMDLAWNLKRGIGPRSHDAIVWVTPADDHEVVDFAVGFDAYEGPMALAWQIVEGPPGYDTYTDHPGC